MCVCVWGGGGGVGGGGSTCNDFRQGYTVILRGFHFAKFRSGFLHIVLSVGILKKQVLRLEDN